MKCTACGSEAIGVYRTERLPVGGGGMIRRYRRCLACGARFVTYEEYSHDVRGERNGRAEAVEVAADRDIDQG